jgi:bifunctional non-homologous end joining protein LigD
VTTSSLPGKVGTGFDSKLLLELRARLDASRFRRRRFTKAVGASTIASALGAAPRIVVQVGFIEWTGNDKLRHPRLLGVRRDKIARAVTRERP